MVTGSVQGARLFVLGGSLTLLTSVLASLVNDDGAVPVPRAVGLPAAGAGQIVRCAMIFAVPVYAAATASGLTVSAVCRGGGGAALTPGC